MGVLDFFRYKENRNLENPSAPVSASDFLSKMGWGDPVSSSGVTVTVDRALGVPSIWSAVNFLSGTIAGLPLHVYTKDDDGRRMRVSDGVEPILNKFANDDMSSFEWLKYSLEQVFTGGRAISVIERNKNGGVVNIYPLDPVNVSVKRINGKKVYFNGDAAHPATNILDWSFMLKSNGTESRSPIMTNKDVIGMAISATLYGSKVFQDGGIPATVLQGPFQSAAGAVRASDDVSKTMQKLARDGRPVMVMPLGHELKSLGFNPDQMQLLELQRFCVEQVARIYSLPPVFLQDLSRGTFSNTEQQDLHFVKHTVKRWVEQIEAEINLKVFGRGSTLYAEFNVDGLLRGDFKTRMEAHAASIQNGIRTPNEVRDIENMHPRDEGDDLMIQGATVPIRSQGGAEA